MAKGGEGSGRQDFGSWARAIWGVPLLSPEGFAERAGLHRKCICGVERGAHNISLYDIGSLADSSADFSIRKVQLGFRTTFGSRKRA